MTHQEITDGLQQLGFDSGWVVNGEEITLWEHPEPQPTKAAIAAAAAQWTVTQEAETEANATAKAALLARLGITADEAKLLLG
jgi:MOSC domain-containing protein YiiM